MYTVVRADIEAGHQLCQTAHAVANFVVRNPVVSKDWNTLSNVMVSLSTPNLMSLQSIASKLSANKIPFVLFYEPDINEHTAICTTDAAASILSGLPLALKTGGVCMVQKRASNTCNESSSLSLSTFPITKK